MKKPAKWDGERFKPRLIDERELPLAETASVDLEILKADLVVADRGLEDIFAMYKQCDDGAPLADGVRRLVITMFDDSELVLTGKTIQAIIRQLGSAMAAPDCRWREAKLTRGAGTHELQNPNREEIRVFTDGQRIWRNGSRKCGGGMANCAAAKKLMNEIMSMHREPTPRERMDWAESFFRSLPKVEDFTVNTMDEPERWNAWAEMGDGERIETSGGSDREAGEKLLAEINRRKTKMIRGGSERVAREYRVEKHPLNEAKFDVAVPLAKAKSLFEQHGEDSSVAKAWQAGLDLGMAIERMSRIAATPDIMRAVAMNSSLAGSCPKSKTKHLKDDLARWLRDHDVDAPKASLVADFFEYASTDKEKYRVTGKGVDDTSSSIRHKLDKQGLKLAHLERNVIPAVLKSFSERRSAERRS